MFRSGIKHVRHPVRSLRAVARQMSIYLDIWKFGRHSFHIYRKDARFNLDHVSRGFAEHRDESVDDTRILERICTAYAHAAKDERLAPEAFRASVWWQKVRDGRLGPVTRALAARDIQALRGMYRNFFRNSCSTGLAGVHYGMSAAYFGGKIRDLHRRFYLGDALHTLDYWKVQTGGSFPLRELAGPDIGNPFGILIDGTLVRTRAAYQHYSARRIIDCLDSTPATVVEIGGGYGGTAHYLLRDRPGIRYIDFDLPESLALTSYYLLRAFPNLRFLLYGEGKHTPDAIGLADVVLMPTYTINCLPENSANVVFSSHSLSDVSSEALRAYLPVIERITKGYFLYIGNTSGAQSIEGPASGLLHRLELLERRGSGWNSHRVPNVEEVECLFKPADIARKRSTERSTGTEEQERCHSLAN